MTALQEAVAEYIDRQEGKKYPKGYWKRRRWFPSEDESQECCRQIKGSTYRFPTAYRDHCYTIKHIACIFDVNQTELRKAIELEYQLRHVPFPEHIKNKIRENPELAPNTSNDMFYLKTLLHPKFKFTGTSLTVKHLNKVYKKIRPNPADWMNIRWIERRGMSIEEFLKINYSDFPKSELKPIILRMTLYLSSLRGGYVNKIRG